MYVITHVEDTWIDEDGNEVKPYWFANVFGQLLIWLDGEFWYHERNEGYPVSWHLEMCEHYTYDPLLQFKLIPLGLTPPDWNPRRKLWDYCLNLCDDCLVELEEHALLAIIRHGSDIGGDLDDDGFALLTNVCRILAERRRAEAMAAQPAPVQVDWKKGGF